MGPQISAKLTECLEDHSKWWAGLTKLMEKNTQNLMAGCCGEVLQKLCWCGCGAVPTSLPQDQPCTPRTWGCILWGWKTRLKSGPDAWVLGLHCAPGWGGWTDVSNQRSYIKGCWGMPSQATDTPVAEGQRLSASKKVSHNIHRFTSPLCCAEDSLEKECCC